MSARPFIRLGALAVAGATAFAPIAAQAAPLTAVTSTKATSPAAPASKAAPAIARATVIANAETWHPHTASRIPYSQTATHNGYRTDCSGYASMALGLRRPGLNTVGLAASSVSTPISMGSLLTGDLVIDATGNSHTRHVVIFEKWTSAAHRSYVAYEQRGGYGTDHRTLTYGLSSGSEFHAFRPRVLG